MNKLTCKCGAKFSDIKKLREHIAIQNPKWPRVSSTDAHAVKQD